MSEIKTMIHLRTSRGNSAAANDNGLLRMCVSGVMSNLPPLELQGKNKFRNAGSAMTR
jgi:hypothetical protein